MHYIIFCCVLLCITFFHYTRLSSALAGPDLSIAFLAWIIIASGEKTVLIRAWMLGFCMDILDPASHSFYMLLYTFLAVIFLPIRSIVFQRSYVGWFVWAVCCHCIVAYMTASAMAYAPWSRILFDAAFTGIFTVIIGFFANELPRRIHPLGGPDVP